MMVDPFANELLALTTDPFERGLIENTTWAHLLYQMRNFRVHEMRGPGGGVDLIVRLKTEPCYLMLGTEPDLHFVMHSEFVALLAHRGIYALQDYLLANDVNPYQNLRDTHAWEVKEFTPLSDAFSEP